MVTHIFAWCCKCRFDVSPVAMSASVHIYADGSVLVQSGGLEMGQGLATKIKQVCAFLCT